MGLVLLGVAVLSYAISGVNVAQGNGLLLVASVAVAGLGLWVLVTRLRPNAALIAIIILALLEPPVRVASNTVVYIAWTAIALLTGLALLAAWSSRSGAKSFPRAMVIMSLFVLLHILTSLVGYATWDIRLGAYFWSIGVLTFGTYALTIYVASQARLRPGTLRFLLMLVIVVLLMVVTTGFVQSGNNAATRTFFYYYYELVGSGEQFVSSLQSGELRPLGITGNPNVFSMAAGMGALLSAAMVIRTRLSAGKRVLLALVAAVFVTSVVASGSRSGLLSFLLGGSYLGVLALRQAIGPRQLLRYVPSHTTTLLSVLMLATASIFTLMLLIRIGTPVGAEVEKGWERFVRTVLPEPFREESVQTRLRIAIERGSLLRNSPILGFGPSEGLTILLEVQSEGTTESELVTIALQYGLIGLTLYAAFWLVAFRQAFLVALSTDNEISLFGHAVVAILIHRIAASIGQGAFYDERLMPVTCVLIGLCAAAARWRQDALVEKADAQSEQLAFRSHRTNG